MLIHKSAVCDLSSDPCLHLGGAGGPPAPSPPSHRPPSCAHASQLCRQRAVKQSYFMALLPSPADPERETPWIGDIRSAAAKESSGHVRVGKGRGGGGAAPTTDKTGQRDAGCGSGEGREGAAGRRVRRAEATHQSETVHYTRT